MERWIALMDVVLKERQKVIQEEILSSKKKKRKRYPSAKREVIQ